MHTGHRGLVAASLLMLMAATLAEAQTVATPVREEEQLERDFTDPLTTLPQVIIRDSYTPANRGTAVETNQALIRPLIPRIPPNSILFSQLIRPTFSLVTVPGARGGTRTEFVICRSSTSRPCLGQTETEPDSWSVSDRRLCSQRQRPEAPARALGRAALRSGPSIQVFRAS
jgi:hypothetical protein